MTDLNIRMPEKQDETPIGVIILTLLPFALALWMLIERGL